MRAERRRPQRVIGEDDGGHRGQIERQHHQREADAEQPVDAAGEKDLDDETRRGDPEANRAEERRQRVGLSAALELLGRHAHLQVEDGGAKRAEADDHGDQLDLPRGEEEPQRFARTQPAEFFFAARASHGMAFAPEHPHHDDDAERERCRAHEQEGVGTDATRRRAR